MNSTVARVVFVFFFRKIARGRGQNRDFCQRGVGGRGEGHACVSVHAFSVCVCVCMIQFDS